MHIDPTLAAEMLTRNDSNRPLSEGTVDHYARQMTSGAWHYTRVPVIFSEGGRLMDGQHRLSACVKSGKEIVTDVVFGSPDDSFAYIDTGRKRTAGDIFAINGVKDYSKIAAITKVVMRYYAGGRPPYDGAEKFTSAELYEYLCENDDIHRSLGAYGHFKTNRLATPSLMAGIYVVCARKNRTQADAFFEISSNGFGAEKKTDPAFILHGKFIEAATKNMRLTPAAQMGLTINAWNRMRDGHSGRGLLFNAEQKMPRVR